MQPEQTNSNESGVNKALELVNKSVNTALAPISGFIWSYEKIKGFISEKVSEKLHGVPPEDIIAPKPHIAVPAIEALRYTGSEEELSDMYANLLASSMDIKTATNAHPSFVEIIKQMTPDEAKLMRYFSNTSILPLITLRIETAGSGGHDVIKHFSFFGEKAECSHSTLVPSYLDNLSRLGLIKIPDNYWYTDESIYLPLEKHPTIDTLVQAIPQVHIRMPEMPKQTTAITKKQVQVTELGRLFISSCLTAHRQQTS